MRTRLPKLLATLLLGVFSVYLVPKELVHALYGHEDTHEIPCSGNENSIGVLHIHCDFLSYEASLFTLTSVTNCPVSAEHTFAFTVTEAEQSGITLVSFPSLRGPPQLV